MTCKNFRVLILPVFFLPQKWILRFCGVTSNPLYAIFGVLRSNVFLFFHVFTHIELLI